MAVSVEDGGRPRWLHVEQSGLIQGDDWGWVANHISGESPLGSRPMDAIGELMLRAAGIEVTRLQVGLLR